MVLGGDRRLHRDLFGHPCPERPMSFDENNATPCGVPATERWRLLREMLKEPDDKRRQELVRQHYRDVTRDMLANYREVDGDPEER
jgi:hypothetical protein